MACDLRVSPETASPSFGELGVIFRAVPAENGFVNEPSCLSGPEKGNMHQLTIGNGPHAPLFHPEEGLLFV